MSYSSRNCMISEEKAKKIRMQEIQKAANFRKVSIAFEQYYKEYKQRIEEQTEIEKS